MKRQYRLLATAQLGAGLGHALGEALLVDFVDQLLGISESEFAADLVHDLLLLGLHGAAAVVSKV